MDNSPDPDKLVANTKPGVPVVVRHPVNESAVSNSLKRNFTAAHANQGRSSLGKVGSDPTICPKDWAPLPSATIMPSYSEINSTT